MSQGLFDEKERIHRYKMWLLAKSGGGKLFGSPQSKRARSSKPINKLTDLETLMLLYNYGRPMETAVEGIFTLPNGQSGLCTTKKVSSESVEFAYTTPTSDSPATPNLTPAVGSPVSLDLEELGAFGGVLTSQSNDGFEVEVNHENRSSVSNKLAHMAVKRGVAVEFTYKVNFDTDRIEPIHKDCSFTDHTGTLRKGFVVNLSKFDALIRTAPANIPPLGARIVMRGPEWHGAEIAIAFEIGFIAKFCVPIPADRFSTELRFAPSSDSRF